MKNIFKNIITFSTVASMALTPFMVLAEDEAKTGDAPKTKIAFCEMIKDKTVDDFKKLGEREDAMGDKREERKGAIAALRSKIDTKREDNQKDRQEKFDALIAKWEANAKNADEFEAIADFKAQLKTAIADRQGAVATTVADSRADKDAARAAAQAKIDAALVVLQTKISAALDKAKKDCDEGVSSVTVRINFATAAQAAIDEFKASTKQVRGEVKTELKTVNDERKVELEEARTEFKTFWTTFRDRLKSLFNNPRLKAKTDIELQPE